MTKPDISAVQPLPLRVAHKDYETAYSLLSRLAARNGCTSLPHLFQRTPALLGMPKRPGRELAIDLAAAMSGSERETIAQSTPQHHGPAATIGDYSGRASALSFKLCVECVVEDARKQSEISAKSSVYVRDFWHFYRIHHCRKHWLYLISECRKCKQTFSYTTVSGVHCSCGFDIRKHPRWASDRSDIIREYNIYRKMNRLPAGYHARKSPNLERNRERRVYWSDPASEECEVSFRQLMIMGANILKPQSSTVRWVLEYKEFLIHAAPYARNMREPHEECRKPILNLDW